MQITEVGDRAGRAVERLDVLGQLHQIARDETAGETQVAGYLHQQPGAVAARAALKAQGLLASLHTRLEAHDVIDVAFETLIEGDQKIVGRHGFERNLVQPGAQTRTVIADDPIGGQIGGRFERILERTQSRTLFDKEVEGVDGYHLGYHFDVDGQAPGGIVKYDAREVIAVGILLPVDEMTSGLDGQGIGLDAGARVGGRFHAQHMGAESDRPVETVVGVMTNGYANGHAIGSLRAAAHGAKTL